VNANNGLSNGNWNILARISEIKMIIRAGWLCTGYTVPPVLSSPRRKLIK